MALRKFLVALTIVLIIILTIVVWFAPSREDFRVENPFWNGIKELSFRYPISPLRSLADLPSSPQGTTLILIPYLRFTDTEFETLNNFITKGGTLILADDYGYGNHLLVYLGVRVRFFREPLLDPLVNYKRQWFPRITRIIPSPITNNITSLVLNRATGITDMETDEILALSSSFSFIDLNRSRTPQADEPSGPIPVISRHQLGSGQIILIADPSLLINSMVMMENNDQLMQNIVAMTSGKLFLDQSHLPASNLDRTKRRLVTIRGALVTPAGTLGLVILALAITLIPLWRERRPNHD